MCQTDQTMLNFSRSRHPPWIFIALALWGGQVLAAEPYPVAGLAPHERPKDASVIRTFEATPDWRKKSLTGVAEPHPAGLDFLNSQGAWYTPFTHPGMPGPYDLRGWHAKGGRP